MSTMRKFSGLILFVAGVSRMAAMDLSDFPGFPSDQPFMFSGGYEATMAWSPSTDEDAFYCRSNVPLDTTLVRNPALQANPNARADEARVFFLSQTSVPTSKQSLRPPHGYTWPYIWAFGYWQYVDYCGIWNIPYGCGGNYMIPPADFVDAAHRNGVPVYALMGQGNSSQWNYLFAQGPDGNYIMADKMIDICEYYGFDGYFINFETSCTSAQAAMLRDLMIYFHEAARARHLNLFIHWYDAVTENGKLSYQNALTSANDWFFQYGDNLVSDQMFLNYWYSADNLTNSRTLARDLGRSEFDLYAGVEVEMTSHDILNTSYNSGKWPMIFPEGEAHRTSIGWFNPDAVTWRHAADNDDYYDRAGRFWSGPNRNPSDTESTWHWKGMAQYVPAKSPVTSVPFVTNFCMGHGHKFFVNGEQVGERPWSNRTFQDIPPTWRWITDLDVKIDFTDAYYGGNCISISGDVTSDTDIKLYMTRLPVTSQTNLQVACKTGTSGRATHLSVGIAFEGSETVLHHLDFGNSLTDGWDLKTFSLSSFAGKTIALIALGVDGHAGSGYEIKVGRLGVIEGDADIPAPPTNLNVDRLTLENDTTATIRMSWRHSPDEASGNLYYYNVYRRNPDSSLTHLGGATSDAYFVPEVLRAGNESTTTIELETVNKEFGHSEHATTVISWEGSGMEPHDDSFGLEISSGNPSHGSVRLNVHLGQAAPVVLSVFDMSGRLVGSYLNDELSAGNYSVVTDDMPSGLYALVLSAGDRRISRKVIVLN